jgi:5-methylcytosine-specific restriction endonuclease McrA
MATGWKPKTIKPFMKRSSTGVTRIVRDGYNTGKESWWDISKRVRVRDGGKCFYCRCQENPKIGLHDVHHLRELSKGGTTTMANLALVCTKKSGNGCHEKRHKHMR